VVALHGHGSLPFNLMESYMPDIDGLEGPLDWLYDEDEDDEILYQNRLRGRKFTLGSSPNPSRCCPR